MNARLLGASACIAAALLGIACSGASKRSGFDSTANGTDPNGDDGTGTFKSGEGGVTNANCTTNNSSSDPNKDYDGDGYALKDDCNECDPNVNKGAYDFPGNGIDEDCDGTADNETTDCDSSLDIAGSDAFDGAKAMGLCKKATDDTMWGVVSAKWVLPDGSSQPQPLSEGILAQFGVNPPAMGASMLALSSGSARQPTDSGYHNVSGWDKGVDCGTPAGYPKDSPACSSGGLGGLGGFGGAHDGAALQLVIRVPSNAKSFSYQQNFFTYEFPEYICSEFNDFFVTMLDPKPSSLPDGNIAFDQDGNPISVNNSMLQVCKKQNAGGKNFTCPLGDSTLAKTGFEGHAATGWLTTTMPIDNMKGKTITLTWAVWDQGDGVLDSTALVDDFEWSVDAASGAATLPSTPH
ncbi:MAG TPA: putative metal-binding motif-containing protein [Labilithrix sp.]